MLEGIMFCATLLKVKVVYPDFAYRNKHLSLGKYVYKFTCVIISLTRFLHVSQGIESPGDPGWKNESQQFQRQENGIIIFVEKQFLEGIFQSPWFCFVYFVCGRLILSDVELYCLQSTADEFPNATPKWGEVDCVSWWGVWWSPGLCRGVVLVLQLCVKCTGLWNVQLHQTRSGFLARLFLELPRGVCLWWAGCCGN